LALCITLTSFGDLCIAIPLLVKRAFVGRSHGIAILELLFRRAQILAVLAIRI
jgi:hypothetical protein